MMRRAAPILAALLLLAGVAPATSAEDMPTWPGRAGQYVFDVTRNGDSIGTQVVAIQQQGDTVIATTESKIAVKLLGIVVYRLHQVLRETYKGGHVVAVRGETVDGNGKRLAELTRDANGHWTGHYNQERIAFVCEDCTTSTMPHAMSMRGTQMIETSTGKLRKVAVVDRGMESLRLPAGQVAVHHYTVQGEIARDVWYDSTGNLVEAAQLGSDGSKIHQTLTSEPATP